MQHAAELPKVPATKAIAAGVAALVLGAGAATGAYALVDGADDGAAAPRVIVVETPAPAADSDLRGSKASATGESATGESAAGDSAARESAAPESAAPAGAAPDLRGSKASATGAGATGQSAAP